MTTAYKVSDEPRSAEAFAQLEWCYQTLHDYLFGRAEVPSWLTFMSQFRAGLDLAKAEATTFSGGPST